MKNKTVAALLAFFLGTYGGQFFYLGKAGRGVLCILFCWTLIPTFIGIIDFIRYLGMSEGAFNLKFNGVIGVQPQAIVPTTPPLSPPPAKDIAQTVTKRVNIADELIKLNELKEKGIITDLEFTRQKEQLLK